MKKPLLVEVQTGDIALVESEGKKGTYVGKGTFGRVDTPTANNRVYPRKVIERELGKLAKPLQERQVYGELDHPNDGKTLLTRASHIITKLELKEDGVVYGEFEILNTDTGKNLKAILDGKGKVGISSRGFGSTKNINGQNVIQDDYMLSSFDVVANPATTGGYPEIFIESLDTTEKVSEALIEVKTNFPQIYDAVKEEQIPLIRESLKADFEKTLIENIEKERVKIEEEVKKDVKDKLEDKEVSAFSKIKEIVSALGVGIDEGSEMGKMKEKLEEAAKDRDKAESIARQLAYKQYISEALEGFEGKDYVLKVVGDVSKYDSSDTLKAKVEAVKEQFEEMKSAIEESNKRDEDEKNEEIVRLRKSIARLESIVEDQKVEMEYGEEEHKTLDDVLNAERKKIKKYEAKDSVRSRVKKENLSKINKIIDESDGNIDVDSLVKENSIDNGSGKKLMESIQNSLKNGSNNRRFKESGVNGAKEIAKGKLFEVDVSHIKHTIDAIVKSGA